MMFNYKEATPSVYYMAISHALIKGKISDGTVPSKHGIKRRASPSAKAISDVFPVFIVLLVLVLLSVVRASFRARAYISVSLSACVLVCRSVVLSRVLLFTVWGSILEIDRQKVVCD